MKKTRPAGATLAFSLIELLVVMGIMAALLAVAIPAFRGIGEAHEITIGGNLVVSELHLARQTALSQSQEVELRFLKVPTENGGEPAFRAMQKFRVADGKPLGKMVFLSDGVAMSDRGAFSTLLSSLNGGTPASRQKYSDSTEVEYRFIRFASSGRTHLDPRGADGGNDRWFLTVVRLGDLKRADTTRPADNFATIQVDPITGRTRTFRP